MALKTWINRTRPKMSILFAPTSRLAAALLLAAALPCAGQQRLLLAQSEIVFTIRESGVPVEGRFRKFDAQLAFDPRKPEASKVALAIDLMSASIGDGETEAELAKPDWFDTRSFARATFQSSAVRALGLGRFDVAGRLSIKGASREIVVPVALAQTGGVSTASGSFMVKRLDFKIGDGDWKDTSLVANEVQVRFNLAVQGMPPR